MLSSNSNRQSEPSLLVTGRVTGRSCLPKITALRPSAYLALVPTFIYIKRSVSASESSLSRFASCTAYSARPCYRGISGAEGVMSISHSTQLLQAIAACSERFVSLLHRAGVPRASPGRPVLHQSRPASG